MGGLLLQTRILRKNKVLEDSWGRYLKLLRVTMSSFSCNATTSAGMLSLSAKSDLLVDF